MKDLTGQTSYNRTITGISDKKQGGHWKWNFFCNDCNKTGTIRESAWLKAGCFCTRKAKPIINMSGQKYGKLTCTDQYRINNHNHTEWLCDCECGNNVWCTRPNLIGGGSTSCGCVHNLIDWNGMRFHSRWEIYIAMILENLKITYEREKDKLEVVNDDNKIYHYTPDFTVRNCYFSWIEVKGTDPKTIARQWKAEQIVQLTGKLLIVHEKELNELLGVKYRNIDRLYSKGGFPLVQNKINQIMSDPDHANKVRKMLSFIVPLN